MASPESVHDLKWMSFFSESNENNIHLITEKNSKKPISEKTINLLLEKHIYFSGEITPYSLLKPLSLLKSVRFIRKTCKEQNIDIVHAMFATPYAMWAYFSGRRFIITTRGSDVMKVLPDLKNSPNNKKYLLLLYFLFKKAFLKATVITSTSEGQVRKIKKLFGRNDVKIIRTGVDVESISDHLDKNNLPLPLQNLNYINSPRWIAPLYNSLTQARAILLLDDSIINNYTFVFFYRLETSDAYLKEFEAILQSKKQIKYIVLNNLPQRLSLACIKFASLNIMIPERDGTPNSALEAMAAKCPLIVGNFEYDEDLFTDTCIRLKENTAEALSDAITKALKDYPVHYIKNAFNKVSEFGNRPVEMDKIKVLYEKIINN